MGAGLREKRTEHELGAVRHCAGGFWTGAHERQRSQDGKGQHHGRMRLTALAFCFLVFFLSLNFFVIIKHDALETFPYDTSLS